MSGIEVWAATVIGQELGAKVVRHDNQSRDSMYDLRIGSIARPDAAIEVTMAADTAHMEATNLLPHKIQDAPSLTGLWFVSIEPTRARINKLSDRLEPLLAQFEARYSESDLVYENLRSPDMQKLADLGVLAARRTHRDEGGALLLSMPPAGGIVDRDGQAFVAWVGNFLRTVPDVLHKLRISNAIERHVFIPIVAPHGAPWSVTSFLNDFPLSDGSQNSGPQTPPDLPEPVTHAWVTGTADRFGWRWNGARWSRFQAAGPPIDDRYAAR